MQPTKATVTHDDNMIAGTSLLRNGLCEAFQIVDDNRLLAEGGHGAYLRNAFGFHSTEAIIATGPQRRMLKNASLPISFGAPFGDNMMTGTVGLLEAIRRRKQMAPISYV